MDFRCKGVKLAHFILQNNIECKGVRIDENNHDFLVYLFERNDELTKILDIWNKRK